MMDNARDAQQVQPLIPPVGCLLLVTSRLHFALAGLVAKDLSAFPPADARDFLLKIEPRIDGSAEAMANLCGYLPIALRAAATALVETPNLKPEDYVVRLQDERKRVGLVEASLSLSYELLTDELKKRFRALAVFPDTFDDAGAAAVWEMEKELAQDALGTLVRYSLVDYNAGTERYRLHDLIRVFAAARLDAGEGEDAGRRHSLYYETVAREAKKLYLGGGDALKRGLALFDQEWLNISAGQAWAAAHAESDDEAARLCSLYPDAGVYCLTLRLHPRQQIRWLEAALAAARRLQDRGAEGVHLGNLGYVYDDLGEFNRAIGFYEQYLAIAREIGDRRGEGNALGNLGVAYKELGKLGRAVEFYERQLAITRETGYRRGEGNALGNLGIAYKELGEFSRAIEFHEQRLTIAREIGDRLGEGEALCNLGVAYARLGDLSRAIEFYEQQLDIAREMGDRRGEGAALWNMSLAFDKLGDRARAIAHAEAALAIFEHFEDPITPMVCRTLDEWRKALG